MFHQNFHSAIRIINDRLFAIPDQLRAQPLINIIERLHNVL